LLKIVETGQPDKYTKAISVIHDNDEIASGKVYLADEQEAKIFRQKLKKKVKEGDPYSVKIIFKNEEYARKHMEETKRIVKEKFSQVDVKHVFLLVERNGRLEKVEG
jgi:DNA primase large subunit